jgi:hypothetical protein
MVFLVLLAVPLIVAIGGYMLSRDVTLKELGVQVIAQAALAGAAAAVVHYSSVHDTEVWNGVVTAKESNHVSCEHPYPCHCKTNKKGETSCDTCYAHAFDVDWDVHTSNGETITIDRLDGQGLSEPPRFTRVVIGEPTTRPHGYTNYIKASPDTLFRHQGLVDKYRGAIPSYPDKLYDYFHIDKLVTVGVKLDDAKEWNEGLEKINAEVGRPKQANVIVVVVSGKLQEYFYALEEAWMGGKKNDIVLVIDVDERMEIQWATVMAWTTKELFKVRLRDDVMMSPHVGLDRTAILADLKLDITDYYTRKPMSDFEYLESSITPTPTQWGISLFFSLAAAIGLTILFIRVDVFGDEGRRRAWRDAGDDDGLLSNLGMGWAMGRLRRKSGRRS